MNKRSLHFGHRVILTALGLLLLLYSDNKVDAQVEMRTEQVAMRDGIKLSTDIYQDPKVKSAPVVLMRTPYNKQRAKAGAERFASAGYIAVVQDCRGKFESEGVFIPYNNEGQDGFDTIEWITKQLWCNGRIGMWGSSYVGATQWQAAAEHPPGLVTITPTATWSSFYRNLYLGGAVRHSLIATWAAGNSPKPEGAVATADWSKTLMHLPMSEIDDQVGWPIPWLEAMLTHPSPDGYWKRLDLTNDILELEMPIQHVVGYYDFFSRESVYTFSRMQTLAKSEKTRRSQQLILGPWDHGTIGAARVGDVDFGSEAVWDSTAATLAWVDKTLKLDSESAAEIGSNSPSAPFVPVRYFMMGENKWRESQSWPPEGYSESSFYLHSDGKANTARGEGKISQVAPTTEEQPDQFVADPSNPVPACPVTPQRALHAAHWGPVDQRPIEEREDVLCYTSDPLTKPLTFAGNLKAELFVSTDTVDADWVVKVIDVYPDGTAINLAVGIQRGRYRESELESILMVPGKVYRLEVDLGPVAAQLPVGHSLRVDICSSYFPLFDRNPNSGEGPFGNKTAIATEKIYHAPSKASRIILPLAKED